MYTYIHTHIYIYIYIYIYCTHLYVYFYIHISCSKDRKQRREPANRCYRILNYLFMFIHYTIYLIFQGLGNVSHQKHPGPTSNCDFAPRASVHVRRYGSGEYGATITMPADNSEKHASLQSAVQVATRVTLARVARHNSSGSRAYTRELRAFFDCSAKHPSDASSTSTGAAAVAVEDTSPLVVAQGDIFGIWVATHSGGGAPAAFSDSESDTDEALRADTRDVDAGTVDADALDVHAHVLQPADTPTPAHTHISAQTPTARPSGDAGNSNATNGEQQFGRPGFDLVYFQVATLESAESAKEGSRTSMLVDISRTIMSAQVCAHSRGIHICTHE